MSNILSLLLDQFICKSKQYAVKCINTSALAFYLLSFAAGLGSWDFLKEPELELEPSKFLAAPAPIQL